METINTAKQEHKLPDFQPYENEPNKWFSDDFNAFLLWCVKNKVSDIAVSSNQEIRVRLYGNWRKATRLKLITNDIECLLYEMTRSPASSARLKGGNDIEFPYEVAEGRLIRHRFRCQATSMHAGNSMGISIVIRLNSSIPPDLDALNPEQMLLDYCFPSSGLVLVCGTMGTGKSTLLASMMRRIIETQHRHVITYENPIEFDLMSFENAKGFCVQTSVPDNLSGFDIAPRNAARRAADVILVGEARERETIRGVIEAAEIGVAAYATVHTLSVSEAPSRMINTFPADLQSQVTATLISALRLIVSQRLVPREGGGLVAIRSMLGFDAPMRDELIRLSFKELIPKIQQFERDRGQTVLQDAKQKYADGLISKETMNKLSSEMR